MNSLEITATMLVEVFLLNSKVTVIFRSKFVVKKFSKKIQSENLKILFVKYYDVRENLLAENSAHPNDKKNVEYGASNNGTDTNIGFSEENSYNWI